MDDSGSQKKTPNFNTYHYDAQLALAFQSDCENFLQKFKNEENFSFQTFAKLWKEACFLAIYKGQEYILGIQAFLENCFFITKKFLFWPDPYIQVGAVYMLYGLYYKQPIKAWVKIRLTQPEFDKLNEICEIQEANKSLDIVFIYHKMRVDGALQYCALVQPLGLDARFQRRYDLSSTEDIKQPPLFSKESVLTKFNNMVENDPELDQFEETDTEYQNLAKKFMDKSRQLFVFPSKIGQDLKKAHRDVFSDNVEECEEDEGKLDEIKNRALRNTCATYRGDRKVLTAVDLDMPSTSKK